jgi:glycosyltransferase involved in cell wall biosynthesis
MLRGATVVVVVPAFDEETRIRRVIESIPRWVDWIVVVDDASVDRTAEAARADSDSRVLIHAHERNRGVGAAIVSGYRRALSLTKSCRDAIAVMAGDAQMDPRDLATVVLPIVEGRASYVKGNRYDWPSARAKIPFGRWLIGHALSLLTSGATGLPIHDSQCGYTAISRGVCLRLNLSSLWQGYGYPNDLLGQLSCLGVDIREVPVRPVYGDEISRLRPYHGVNVLWLIGRAWVRRRALVQRR